MTAQELHNLAMEIVEKKLESEGFEFMTVNSKLDKDPQFVCLKDKVLHFIIVRAIQYPDNPLVYNEKFMRKIYAHANKLKAFTCYAGVGLAHATDYTLPLTTSSPYAINYQGLQKIKTDA